MCPARGTVAVGRLEDGSGVTRDVEGRSGTAAVEEGPLTPTPTPLAYSPGVEGRSNWRRTVNETETVLLDTLGPV